jgi:sulfite reductase (ferredoxin)
MQSFRTELENPIVEKDIIELEKKIYAFRAGKMDEDRFRSLRLARGIYGQRQPGVQMVRIKLPFGKCTPQQLERLAAVSDTYSNGNLHITTRQDVQIHYVSLDKTPELWEQLEQDDITIREACGNTVRNITASTMAGIDPDEPFDVRPYAWAMFEFFLRNPVCQDMGRKFKIAFSASEKDSAYTWIHDLGFIPALQDGHRGFKVLIGGGIGSQPRHADVLYDWLPTDKIIPLTEAVLRVFDRYGERDRRQKARLKFLIQDVGLDGLRSLIQEMELALSHAVYPIEDSTPFALPILSSNSIDLINPEEKQWFQENVSAQKQAGYYAIGVRITNGDLSSNQARGLAALMRSHDLSELTFTMEQGLLIRHVPQATLSSIYQGLKVLGLATSGYGSIRDIVSCPGTVTCNLGIGNAMGLARALEALLDQKYALEPRVQSLKIKISGCMNACGQHTIADIGFQGMTIKVGQQIAPATQVLLGGGGDGQGQGRFADKVTKVLSKRVPQVLDNLLTDFLANANSEESYAAYYQRKGTDYFYQLLKPLSEIDAPTEEDFVDWGDEQKYEKAIGIGECAGVTVDLVATLLVEAEEKLNQSQFYLASEQYADSAYATYTALLYAAKAILTGTNAKLNTQAAIIKAYDEQFGPDSDYYLGDSFAQIIYQINHHSPSKSFAEAYLSMGHEVLRNIQTARINQVSTNEKLN